MLQENGAQPNRTGSSSWLYTEPPPPPPNIDDNEDCQDVDYRLNNQHQVVENGTDEQHSEFPQNFFFTTPPTKAKSFVNSSNDTSCSVGKIEENPVAENTYNNGNDSAMLHGAFATPLNSSPSRFRKRPFIKSERSFNSNHNDSNNNNHRFVQNNSYFSSPSKKNWSFQNRKFSTPSPANMNEAKQLLMRTPDVDSDDPFYFKPTPIVFMLDHSPVAPFFTRWYCFSNHYPCEKLEIDGERFICTEQYYMFYKARVFGDRRAMREIKETNDPKMMKKIGASVVGFDSEKWYKIAIQVVVIASIRKFEQNPALRRHLFETSGADLVETNPMDHRWGIGLGLGDWRVLDKKMWKGPNWLGRILTMLRDKLLEREEYRWEKTQLLKEIAESFEAANMVGCLQKGTTSEENFDEKHGKANEQIHGIKR